MPIVTVRVVAPKNNDLDTSGDGVVRRLADALGEALDTEPGRTWVTLRTVPSSRYAENGVPREETPLPVFVDVLKAAWPDEATLAEEAARLAIAVADAVGRPVESIHIIYQPPAAGRVAFGGRLVPSDARSGAD